MIDWHGLYDLGFSLFPIRARTKQPAVRWKPYQQERASLDQIEEWSRGRYNVGIATGQVSGLMVLDLDSGAAVDQALKYGLPETPCVATGKGGHVYFAHQEGTIPNRASFLPGMDLRGDGGYVVGPGSIHPTGVRYDWIVSPDEAALAAPPRWLLDALATRPASVSPFEKLDRIGAIGTGDAAVGRELAKLRRTPEGARNEQLNKSAFTIARLAASGETDADAARERLREAAAEIGLNACEIDRTIESGWNAGLGHTPYAALAVNIVATPFPWRPPTEIPPRPWLYARWFMRGAVTAVVAPGGLGKSALMAGTALALVSGKELLGKAVWEGPRRVWLWNLEDDSDELARQLSAFALRHRLTPKDCGRRLFVDSAMDGMGLCTAVEDAQGFRIITPVYEAVLDALKRHEIDVLIVDPFVSSHKVDENANFKIDAIAKQWGRVAAEARCAVVLVHHSRKPAGQKVDTEAARGASALVNATRSVLVLNRLTADEAKSFSIEGDDQRRRYFSVADDKHNRAPPEKADWYRIVSVPLGNGTADRLGGREDGDEVGAVERWTPPDPCEGISDADLRLVQDAVAKGEWRESVQANAWVGRTAARVLGLDADDPADRRRLKMLIKKWLANGVLRIERRKDGSRQERSFVVPGAPVA